MSHVQTYITDAPDYISFVGSCEEQPDNIWYEYLDGGVARVQRDIGSVHVQGDRGHTLIVGV